MDSLSSAISFLIGGLGGLVSLVLGSIGVQIAGFVLSFFPEANQNILGIISTIGEVLSGGGLTFNYFYFIDMAMVAQCFAVWLLIVTASLVTILINHIITLVQRVLDMVPVVE